MNDLIVIGGGPAGVTAALRARELGARLTLVEKERLGGTCTNDGCVPTRAWARAARLRREAEQYANFGLVGHLPELDFPRLLTRTQQGVYQSHEKKQILSRLELYVLSIAMEEAIETFPKWGQAKYLGGLMRPSRKVQLALPLMGRERGLMHGRKNPGGKLQKSHEGKKDLFQMQ